VKVVLTAQERRFLQENESCRLATCSLKRLISLPDPTMIYLGHEGESTIRDERASNPVLLSGDLS
jgi:hypothetical protein